MAKITNTAFPQPGYGGTNAEIGLTKREFFASIAMQGLLSNITKITGEWKDQLTPAFIAEKAVKSADALIAELKKTSGSVS